MGANPASTAGSTTNAGWIHQQVDPAASSAAHQALMNYFLHAAVLATVSAAAFGAACSQDGSSYSYTESVTTTANTRTIVTNQCPNHPYHSINSVSPASTSTTITMPSYPKLKGSSGLNHPGTTDQSPSTIEGTAQVSLAAEGGSIGALFSGAMLSRCTPTHCCCCCCCPLLHRAGVCFIGGHAYLLPFEPPSSHRYAPSLLLLFVLPTYAASASPYRLVVVSAAPGCLVAVW